jgi:hypothetical protein
MKISCYTVVQVLKLFSNSIMQYLSGDTHAARDVNTKDNKRILYTHGTTSSSTHCSGEIMNVSDVDESPQRLRQPHSSYHKTHVPTPIYMEINHREPGDKALLGRLYAVL